MKHKINQSLLKSLVNSDFLIINKVDSKRSLFTDDIINVRSNEMKKIQQLDVFTLMKSLKQTIRLLQTLKKSEKKKLKILINNKSHAHLLNDYLTKNLDIDLTVNSSFSLEKSNLDVFKLLFLLDFPIENKTKIIQRLLTNQFYLISKFNIKEERNNWFTYKVFNNFDDFKKVLFFIALLNQTLKDTK